MSYIIQGEEKDKEDKGAERKGDKLGDEMDG